jgi:hypothetical protein
MRESNNDDHYEACTWEVESSLSDHKTNTEEKVGGRKKWNHNQYQ